MSYETFRDTLRTQKVTDHIFLVDQAHHLDIDLISGFCVCHIIAGGQVYCRLTDLAWRGSWR